MMMFYPGIHWDSDVEKVSQRAVRNGSITPQEVDMAVKTSDKSKPKQPLFAVGDKITKVYPLNPPSAEHQMRDRLKKGEAELRKLPKGLSLITGLLDHLNIKRFEHVPSEDLPDVVGWFEDVYRSAKQ